MQISTQEVSRVQDAVRRAHREPTEIPVQSVEELAARHGVSMDEVRCFTEQVLLSEEDVQRERRVRELAQRVANGTYAVDTEDLIDMAARRAIADRSAEL